MLLPDNASVFSHDSPSDELRLLRLCKTTEDCRSAVLSVFKNSDQPVLRGNDAV